MPYPSFATALPPVSTESKPNPVNRIADNIRTVRSVALFADMETSLPEAD